MLRGEFRGSHHHINATFHSWKNAPDKCATSEMEVRRHSPSIGADILIRLRSDSMTSRSRSFPRFADERLNSVQNALQTEFQAVFWRLAEGP